jgi:hypothetical protein
MSDATTFKHPLTGQIYIEVRTKTNIESDIIVLSNNTKENQELFIACRKSRGYCRGAASKRN